VTYQKPAAVPVLKGRVNVLKIIERKKLTIILWYKYFGAKFTKPLRQSTGSKFKGIEPPAWLKKKPISCATYSTRSWSAYLAPVYFS